MRRDHMKMPLLFKLWFAFVACLALLIVGAVIYVAVAFIDEPEILGRFLGRIVNGFETVTP